jgi:hypothetical protein
MPSDGGGRGRRRRRRSGAEIAKLEALRQAHVERQARVRDNERRVKEALVPFAEAAAGVEAEHDRLAEQQAKTDERLARRLQELDDTRAAALAEAERARKAASAASAADVQEWRVLMGESVRAIRGAGVDLDGTAALLGISAREANALSRLGRPASAKGEQDPSGPGDGASETEGVRDTGDGSSTATGLADVLDPAAGAADGWPSGGVGGP